MITAWRAFGLQQTLSTKKQSSSAAVLNPKWVSLRVHININIHGVIVEEAQSLPAGLFGTSSLRGRI